MSIIKVLSGLEDFVALTGVSKEEIEEAEQELDLKFSPEYREYLLKYGVASGNGHELTGLVDSDLVNVIRITKKARKANRNVPQDIYVIEDPAIDKILVWQNSKGELFRTIKNSGPEKLDISLEEYLKG